MAILNNQDRVSVWEDYMRENVDTFGPMTRQQLRAAVDAVDQWISDNGAAFNAAIPQPARGALSTKQKAHLLVAVVRRRFIAGV